MLRTNSKKAKENIRQYIMDNFNADNYTDDSPQEFNEIAKFILGVFYEEHWNNENLRKYFRYDTQTAFIDWLAGLPSVFDSCYYYNRSAVKDLGDLLEETEEERSKYSEQQAEECLSRLIYKELEGAK